MHASAHAKSSDSHQGSPKETLIAKVIARLLELRMVRAYLHYSSRRGPSLADSVTYRTLFSVFAGVLLGFSLATLWLSGDPDAMDTLVRTLDTMIPGLSAVIDVQSIEAPTGISVVGAISVVGLIGAAIGALGSLRIALQVLSDQVRSTQNVLLSYALNLLMAALFGMLLVAAAVLSVVSSFGLETVAGWFGVPAESAALSILTRVCGIAVVLAIDTLAVALIFRLLSGVSVPKRALWSGALVGGVGLVVLQELSGLFVRGAGSNPLLASFAALIALLLWLNLSAQVILVACSYIVVASAELRDRVRERFGATSFAQLRRKHAEEMLHAATSELRAAQQAEQLEREKK